MFPDTPNPLEAVFVQRDIGNSRYDQINISGSDLIVYLDSNGIINADKISIWATKYGFGGPTGSAATSSWALNAVSSLNSVSSSYAITSSYINGFPFDNSILQITTTGSNFILLNRFTGSYSAAYVNYIINNGASMRAGHIIAAWLNGNNSYSEYATTDIGDTSPVTMSVFISQSNFQLIVNSQNTINWSIKANTTYL